MMIRLVESGLYWAELKAVHLTGRVEEAQDDAEKDRIEHALSQKYDPFKVAGEKMPAGTRDHYSSRIFFRLAPGDRVLAWDNSRLPLQEQS
jgi:hypothetical protein